MKKKNIEAIWMGRAILPYTSEDDEKLITQKVNEARNNYRELELLISSEAKEALNKYLVSQQSVDDLERKNAFITGFSLGVKLVVEGLED